MFTYSMMPLDANHIDELVADIKDQYKRGISTCPMFIMTLVPEGTPVWDKVGPMCEKFRMFKERLEPDGIPVGILIQASLGHGYPLTPTPFTKYVGIKDGKAQNVHCPLDKDFMEHFKGVLRALAKEKPAAIMLDDDFRLMMRPAGGCACALHMKELEKKVGRLYTRDELWAHIDSHPDGDPLTLKYIETQTEALIYAAKEFRAAIDEIDPTIQGINCTSGDLCESVIYTSREFSGKNNPTIVRVPNGTYAPLTTRGFSDIMRRAAVCSKKLKSGGVTHVLAETDTIPFNRYGKNARYLHSQYTASILEGLEGAKHWITRTSSFEPKSGVAFRNILAENSKLYEKLAEMSQGMEWLGVNSYFLEQKYSCYHSKNIWRYHLNNWTEKVLERLGLPFYFSDEGKGVTFLEDDIVPDMTDEQIKEVFDGSVFVSADAAMALINRGYGDLLGVNVEVWDGPTISAEVYDEPSLTSTKQKNTRKITPINEKVEELSHCFRRISGKEREILFPAVTLLDRGEGKISVVYSGTPDAQHTYGEGFAFLNETRKAQFVKLFKRAGALPIYYEGDVEMCLRAGRISDGRMLAAFFNIGYDPLETLTVYLEKEPTAISYLDNNGEEKLLEFNKTPDGFYEIDVRVEPMYPVILLIK